MSAYHHIQRIWFDLPYVVVSLNIHFLKPLLGSTEGISHSKHDISFYLKREW